MQASPNRLSLVHRMPNGNSVPLQWVPEKEGTTLWTQAEVDQFPSTLRSLLTMCPSPTVWTLLQKKEGVIRSTSSIGMDIFPRAERALQKLLMTNEKLSNNAKNHMVSKTAITVGPTAQPSTTSASTSSSNHATSATTVANAMTGSSVQTKTTSSTTTTTIDRKVTGEEQTGNAVDKKQSITAPPSQGQPSRKKAYCPPSLGAPPVPHNINPNSKAPKLHDDAIVMHPGPMPGGLDPVWGCEALRLFLAKKKKLPLYIKDALLLWPNDALDALDCTLRVMTQIPKSKKHDDDAFALLCSCVNTLRMHIKQEQEKAKALDNAHHLYAKGMQLERELQAAYDKVDCLLVDVQRALANRENWHDPNVIHTTSERIGMLVREIKLKFRVSPEIVHRKDPTKMQVEEQGNEDITCLNWQEPKRELCQRLCNGLLEIVQEAVQAKVFTNCEHLQYVVNQLVYPWTTTYNYFGKEAIAFLEKHRRYIPSLKKE